MSYATDRIEVAKASLKTALGELKEAVIEHDYDDLSDDYKETVVRALGDVARAIGQL